MSRQHLKDLVFLGTAKLMAELGTCARRKVGCVFVDHKHRVLATGYNGPASGAPHCIDSPCAGANLPSGTGLEKCEALHAEQNALIQCKFPDDVRTIYCTTAPCLHCIKMLANTGATRLVFLELYPHAEQALAYWSSLGRTWHQVLEQ